MRYVYFMVTKLDLHLFILRSDTLFDEDEIRIKYDVRPSNRILIYELKTNKTLF